MSAHRRGIATVQKKRKTARKRAALKRKGRERLERNSGHKRVRGGRKRK